MAAEVLAGLGAFAAAAVRWLRVAQREHYEAGHVTRFALRWWGGTGFNRLLGTVAVLGTVVSALAVLGSAVNTVGVVSTPLSRGSAWMGIAAAAAIAAGPIGLGLRGRSSPLAWTRRLRLLAGVVVVLLAGVLGIALAVGSPLPVLVAALLAPVVVDLALALTAPFEAWVAGRYVAKAAARIRSVSPVVVGITGSFGKTTTKGYIAHLASPALAVVATPRSFNNKSGLARSVNEGLLPGTQVFVAEMGTYRKGEIAALCSWAPPQISVITAIGPVHLERFGSEDKIFEAKSEILGPAATVVLNVDDPRLAALASRLEVAGAKKVVRAGSVAADRQREDEIRVTREPGDMLVVRRGGEVLAKVERPDVAPSNVACAVAVALELGVPVETACLRLATLPVAASRLTAGRSPRGFTVLDDTYNSNPAGCRLALEALARHGTGRRVVVTPGMVELGPRQPEENRRFGQLAASVATDVVVIGRTNRAALEEGARAGASRLMWFASRVEAVEWARASLGEGDAVLYENDLPDHYP